MDQCTDAEKPPFSNPFFPHSSNIALLIPCRKSKNMDERLGSPGNEENLQVENQFLKLKMMLEHGVHLVHQGSSSSG